MTDETRTQDKAGADEAAAGAAKAPAPAPGEKPKKRRRLSPRAATALWATLGVLGLAGVILVATSLSRPAETELSKTISKDLKKRGFRFCGPTIVYAFMQAVGMVNDHLLDCHRRQVVAAIPPRPGFG